MIHRRCFVIDEDSANGFGGFGLPDEWFATELDNNCFGALTPIYSESYQKENDMSLTETQIEYLSTDGVKLVRACVKRLGGELDREELEQECLLAATYAMRRYDPSRVNTKLSTYILDSGREPDQDGTAPLTNRPRPAMSGMAAGQPG